MYHPPPHGQHTAHIESSTVASAEPSSIANAPHLVAGRYEGVSKRWLTKYQPHTALFEGTPPVAPPDPRLGVDRPEAKIKMLASGLPHRRGGGVPERVIKPVLQAPGAEEGQALLRKRAA